MAVGLDETAGVVGVDVEDVHSIGNSVIRKFVQP